MSIQAFQFLWRANTAIVDPKTGILTQYGQYLLLALYNRTGQGTGIVPVVSPPLVAAGVSIADALQLAADWNFVETTPAGSGVGILPLKPGNDIQVFNGGGNNLNIYPPNAAWQIDALGAGAPYVLTPGKLRIFECWAMTQLYSFGS